MSKYLDNIQGEINSNPINETNTVLPIKSKVYNAVNATQFMGIESIPVSNIDTNYYDDYRDTVESLRKSTETHYDKLESCLVPYEVKGMAFQPINIVEHTDDEETITTVEPSFNYFFDDQVRLIGKDNNEYVFRTNKIEFRESINRRFVHDKTIDIFCSQEDYQLGLSAKAIILKHVFGYFNVYGALGVRDTSNTLISINSVIDFIWAEINDKEKDVKYYINKGTIGNDLVKTKADLSNYKMVPGQVIHTNIPASIYNLYSIGWIRPSMIFLNGLAIEWTKAVVIADKADTFVSVVNLNSEITSKIDAAKTVEMSVLTFPFEVYYCISGQNRYADRARYKYPLIFVIDKATGHTKFSKISNLDHTNYDTDNAIVGFDRIYCLDSDIIYDEFELDTVDNDVNMRKIGFNYCKSLKNFCEKDYRYKLKKANFIGFELDRYYDGSGADTYDPYKLGTLKNDDFSVTWHPFNMLDFRFKRLFNKRRVFKVFYNKKVVYDQDNILRIPNKDLVSQEYEKYRRDITGTIDTYIKEVYILAKKDIGYYIANKGPMNQFKYHYVTPYETYLLYKIIMNNPDFTLEDFKSLNVSTLIDPTDEHSTLTYMNGSFVVVPEDDEDAIFMDKVTEQDLFNEDGTVKPNIKSYFDKIKSLTGTDKIYDLLMPIDCEVRDDTNPESNLFNMYQGDTRGKLMPYMKLYKQYNMKPEYEDTTNDILKLRFEFAIINNMEEGSTPIDEMIYYFDNSNYVHSSGFPVVKEGSYKNRYASNILNAMVDNIFNSEGNEQIKQYIYKLNYRADRLIPPVDHYLYKPTMRNTEYQVNTIPGQDQYKDRIEDPRSFYNFAYSAGSIFNESREMTIKQTEWGLRRNLPEMFYWYLGDNEYVLDSIGLLDTVFDFTYDYDKTYIENLTEGTNYILGYDADKLENSIKHNIKCMTKTGKELKAITNSGKLTMSRWNIVGQDNYVMIFKNRVLYDKYHTITYTPDTFTVDLELNNTLDTDIFEFVFFMNANNTIIEKECKTMDDLNITVPSNGSTVTFKGVPSNTALLDPEDIRVYASVTTSTIPDKWKVSTADTAFPIKYKIRSHKRYIDISTVVKVLFKLDKSKLNGTDVLSDGNPIIPDNMNDPLEVDDKVNGLHRITKQGGGEYYVEITGEVDSYTPSETYIINPGTEDQFTFPIPYNTSGRTLGPAPFNVFVTSKRQFRYKHLTIEEDAPAGTLYLLSSNVYPERKQFSNTYIYRIDDDDFNFCTDESHVMVFKNGLLLPNTCYYVHPIIANPITSAGIVLNVDVKVNDSIDIFYLTNDLRHLETEHYDADNRIITNGEIKTAPNGETEYRVMGEELPNSNSTDRTNYIKMISPLYGISNKESVFVFLNGKKVRYDELTNISDTILGISTDYVHDIKAGMNAVYLEVISHLDTTSIIEKMYINDGLDHNTASRYSAALRGSTLQIQSVDLTKLDSYTEQSLLGDILNGLDDKSLNKLFYKDAYKPMTPYKESEMHEPTFAKKGETIPAIIEKFFEKDDSDLFVTYDTGEEPYGLGTVFYIGEKDKVKVPAAFDGVPTKTIFGTTFNGNKVVTNVVIPEGITSIG